MFRAGPSNYPRQLLAILEEIQKAIRRGDGSRVRGEPLKLPDILAETLTRWRNTSRFNGIFEAKKKKFEIYQRIFMENEEIFFFNGKEENQLNISIFNKKYGEGYIKLVELDSPFLKEFGEILHEVMNDYLGLIVKINGRHMESANISGKQRPNQNSSIMQTPSQQTTPIPNLEPFNPFKSAVPSHKKNTSSGLWQQSGKSNVQSSYKEKTPTRKGKGNETRRFNVTPTQKSNKLSPMIRREFGSTSKSKSKKRSNLTPTKSYNGGYNSLYPQTALVYKNSKKEGLEKDSFYEKLFFFRNKRVESFDIVMKRLRGR